MRFDKAFLTASLLFILGCQPWVGEPAKATAQPSEAGQAPPTPTRLFLPLITQTAAEYWIPAINTDWQWQLEEALDQSVEADMYDIDLFDNDASTVQALHTQGRKVVCYISVGSWEDWRPDAGQFPAEVLGNDYEGWPGEKWLDIRRIDLLAPILRARLDQCRLKGFDAVEPDNIDGYTNDTGFPITYAHQLAFNTWLANEAHLRGLSIGLKNDPEQASDLLRYFDWALTEDCFAEGWCDQVAGFILAGKAVFSAEYTDMGMSLADFCPQAQALGFNAILKRRGLDAWRETCYGYQPFIFFGMRFFVELPTPRWAKQ